MTPLIEFKNIKKVFGSIIANQDINLKIFKGTIHGIIGENGAGKSTAMKILYGLYSQTEGEILISGEQINISSPKEALKHKIGMVHQHFMLAETLNAIDNIICGEEKTSPFSFIQRKEIKIELKNLCDKYDFQFDLSLPIKDLSVGDHQKIEILKLLYRKCDILILDEPTAVLTPQEIQKFFKQLLDLKNSGKTILIITHKLKEILELTDRVTVFRKGKVVGEKNTKETNIEELSEMMIGKKMDLNKSFPFSSGDKKSVLNVSNLSLNNKLENINLQVHKKEIVGIAGVEGNGQKELVFSITNPEQFKKELIGHIVLLGKVVLNESQHLLSDEIRKLNFGFLAENRQVQSLLMDFNCLNNFILGFTHYNEYQKNGILKKSEIYKSTIENMKKYDVVPLNPFLKISQFSGGNQQKFVVSRELQNDPDFLIASHPTRGVDIGAIQFIHNEIVKSRDRGAGVLLVSSELDELMKLSDRILVFYRGRIIKEFSKKDFSEKGIGIAMAGQS